MALRDEFPEELPDIDMLRSIGAIPSRAEIAASQQAFHAELLAALQPVLWRRLYGDAPELKDRQALVESVYRELAKGWIIEMGGMLDGFLEAIMMRASGWARPSYDQDSDDRAEMEPCRLQDVMLWCENERCLVHGLELWIPDPVEAADLPALLCPVCQQPLHDLSRDEPSMGNPKE